ncbi:glutaminase, partial [Methylobacterium organophilum]|nr:glutaminase [Methylobacterium organophilum]
MPDLAHVIREISEEMAQRSDRGAVADYIPELARVDPDQFGMAVIDAEGQVFTGGDSETPFSIQSVSKVFTLTLALGMVGDRLWKRVGREPSGNPFNSIVQLERERGVPRNPFINAGAIAVTDVILSGHEPREALGEIQDNIRRTLTPYLGPNNFEVSVVARLNTDKTKTDETIFNPDQKVERSLRTIKESDSSQNRVPQKPTTAQQNLPDQRVRSEGAENSSAESQRREELTNFEISSKTVQTVSDGYSIKTLSVAVLVNRSRLEALAGGAKGGTAPPLDPQVAEIEQLVTSAAGVNRARGDQLKVAAVSFIDEGQPLAPAPALGFTDVLMRQSGTLINAATILIVGCLLIWFGLRPAVNAILARPADLLNGCRAGPEGRERRDGSQPLHPDVSLSCARRAPSSVG